MTNPNDPWGQRPDDAPTEHLGPPGESGYGDPLRTTAYTEPYSTGAPSDYPATAQYGTWAPPGPNATREIPPYDAHWAGYQTGYGDSSAAPPDAAAPYIGQPPRPPRRNTGLLIALGIGVVLLIGAIGVVAGALLGGRDSSPTNTAGASSAPTTSRTAPGARTGKPSVPGLGNADGLGATMGTIAANDGGTLTVSAMTGSIITVRTDSNTTVIAMSGAKVSDLATGEIVLIQGDKAADGSIQAKIIVSVSMPGGGR
ncbi:DUF5666 domain-containing protein [Nocardia sp. NPDC049190]|uniref:DUF5666 domain-containing protein n=1 Tax=Nocardia sp. NPDC049190 TaxID=3155650 RepID=UPI00340B7700